VLMLGLMCGVTTVAASGAYLGVRRLVRRPIRREAGIQEAAHKPAGGTGNNS
jgi:hypothetical protein